MAIEAVIFDWGDTLMRNFNLPGPMARWPRVEAMPGSQEALEALAGRVHCYVASGAAASGAEAIEEALEQVGLASFFDGFFTVGEIGIAKSDPAFYTALMDELGLKPEQCAMVGDTYEIDIAPAKQAGLATVWLAGDDRSGEAPAADSTIQSLADLVAALEALGLAAP